MQNRTEGGRFRSVSMSVNLHSIGNEYLSEHESAFQDRGVSLTPEADQFVGFDGAAFVISDDFVINETAINTRKLKGIVTMPG